MNLKTHSSLMFVMNNPFVSACYLIIYGKVCFTAFAYTLQLLLNVLCAELSWNSLFALPFFF